MNELDVLESLKALPKVLSIGCETTMGNFFSQEFNIIEKALKDYQEIKTYMQQYGIEDIEELRRILHNNWVICQKFKIDTADISRALEIIKEKRVDADYFIYTCVVDDWSYEDYLEEYNSTSSWFICGQHSFGYQGEKQPLLTREEYYLLKEVLS